MLAVVQGAAVPGQRPVHPAELVVQTLFRQKRVGVAGIGDQAVVLEDNGRRREELEDTAVRNTALLRLFVPIQVKIHIAVISAVLFIPQGLPEGEQPPGKLLPGGL